MKELIKENLLLFYVYLAIIVLFIYSRIEARKSSGVYIPEEKQPKINKEEAEESGWIIKKTKLYRIEQVQHKGENDSVIYSEYWLFTKDVEGNKYMSERYRDLEYNPGRSVEEMKVNYKGFEYDLSRKEQSIKQIYGNISRIETELATKPAYGRKLELEKELIKMKEFLSIINQGPNASYVVINGKRITVGDIINVFIDPNNVNNYHFDI